MSDAVERACDLPSGGIAIWTIDLDRADVAAASLSRAERARAARYRDGALRRRFVAGRAAMRSILALHDGRAADVLQLIDGAHGKPALAGSDLCFSLSRSGATALLAVARGRELGVDGERDGDEAAAMREAAEVVMTDGERAIVDACPTHGRAALLRRLWTRKEALAKATGLGLSRRVAAVTVLADDARPLAVEVAGAGRFRVADLALPPGITAALCGAGPQELAPLCHRRFPPARPDLAQ